MGEELNAVPALLLRELEWVTLGQCGRGTLLRLTRTPLLRNSVVLLFDRAVWSTGGCLQHETVI